MGDALPEVLELLARLVGFDTQNPPRAVDRGGIFAFLVEALGPGFAVTLTDHGEGCVSLLAVRGAPTLLFNVHVDTVPRDPRWARDPLALLVEGGRAVGLGACDVKSAAACLLSAARRATGDVAMLFTSDEEAGSSRCVKAFLASPHGFEAVVVAEPTGCRAVVEHRGIASCSGVFHGTGGHASSPRALDDSAVHEAVRWASRALALAGAAESERHGALRGVRFNLGQLAGGIKANMIASSAELRFGVRPLPHQSGPELVARFTALAERPGRVTWTPGFVAPPLPAGDGPEVAARVDRAARLARALGLPAGEGVDFWTEAALFSAQGLTTVVYGAGHIEQAHTAGEWIATAELALATETYQRIVRRGSP